MQDLGAAANRIEAIDSPLTGLVGHSGLLFCTSAPPLFVHYADLGDLNAVLPSSAGRQILEPSTIPVGIGVAADEPTARRAALAEALERYAVYCWRDEQLIWATAEELGPEALALSELPRCSERERERSACGWREPRHDLPLRWTRGISLMTSRQVWLPAALVYLGLEPASNERFTLPNSTGCACHATLSRALLTGACEVIERDAVALTWLHQLVLPRIELDLVPAWLEPYLDTRLRTGLTRHFFDATTDLGVPTVYAVETADHDERVATLVACATDLEPARAIAKVVSDLESHRPAVALEREIPDDPWLFTKSFQGCAYMARPARREAFDFLLRSPRRRRLSELGRAPATDEHARLSWLLDRLAADGGEAYAVELSPDEARAAEVHVVRVIVPWLQPLTFQMGVRYLAHRRFAQAPRQFGHPALSDEEVNPWPQPFG